MSLYFSSCVVSDGIARTIPQIPRVQTDFVVFYNETSGLHECCLWADNYPWGVRVKRGFCDWGSILRCAISVSLAHCVSHHVSSGDAKLRSTTCSSPLYHGRNLLDDSGERLVQPRVRDLGINRAIGCLRALKEHCGPLLPFSPSFASTSISHFDRAPYSCTFVMTDSKQQIRKFPIVLSKKVAHSRMRPSKATVASETCEQVETEPYLPYDILRDLIQRTTVVPDALNSELKYVPVIVSFVFHKLT